MTTLDKGAIEVHITLDMPEDVVLVIGTNVKAKSLFPTFTDVAGDLSFSLQRVSIGGFAYYVIQPYIDSNLVEEVTFGPLNEIEKTVVRFYMYDEFASFYVNGLWLYSFGFSHVEYEDETFAVLSATGGTFTANNIVVSELADHREAVFVDYESTTDNAISSILQQRPVETYAEAGPQISFTYAIVRDVVNAHNIDRIEEVREDSSQMSSDGLVYYSDVAVSVDATIAKEVGLITRMYRMSELETGAVKAAKMLQRKARERRDTVEVNGRFDARVEIGDILVVDTVLTSTGRVIQKNVIVEAVSINATDSRFSMRVSGRKSSE